MGIATNGLVPEQRWVWRARCIHVVDGDTFDAVIDSGFHTTRTERLRLLGINTPEVVGESKAAGLAAKAWAQKWFEMCSSDDWPLIIETTKTDVFGRYLATVWSAWSGDCLNDALLLAGQAVPFEP